MGFCYLFLKNDFEIPNGDKTNKCHEVRRCGGNDQYGKLAVKCTNPLYWLWWIMLEKYNVYNDANKKKLGRTKLGYDKVSFK